MIVWVIGSGGLLGSSIVRRARAQHWRIFQSEPIPWSYPNDIQRVFRRCVRAFTNCLSESEPWSIVWAAGRVTTSSTESEIATELGTFETCMSALCDHLGGVGGGHFLLASSAGGIYAGGTSPPFDSLTPPVPLGTYGVLKFDQELLAIEKLSGQMNVTIARLANLYGPGQDLAKIQGLVSRLALASITRAPISIFVPQDTLRDYMYVDDAAAYILHWLSVPSENIGTRVIATGRATSVGTIVATMQSITRSRIPLSFGIHSSSAVQVRDLRLRPDQDAWTESIAQTPLPAGMRRVYLDVLLRHQQNKMGAIR